MNTIDNNSEDENQSIMLWAIIITLILTGIGFLIAVASIYNTYN